MKIFAWALYFEGLEIWKLKKVVIILSVVGKNEFGWIKGYLVREVFFAKKKLNKTPPTAILTVGV